MNTILKGILLVIAAYLVTLVVTILVVIITMNLLNPRGCSSVGQALLVLWGELAALFFTSVTLVAVLAWKTLDMLAGRLVVIVIHGALTFFSFLVIAFGLMVAFNC